MACSRTEKLKTRPKSKLVIILDDLDFSWTKLEVAKAILMWRNGYSLGEMAKQLRPYDGVKNAIDEVALLIMHLARQGKVGPREGGIFGSL